MKKKDCFFYLKKKKKRFTPDMKGLHWKVK